MPAAANHPPSRRVEATGFASFSTNGNVSCDLSSERENKPVWGRMPIEANDSGCPVIFGSSWPAFFESTEVYASHSFNGSHSVLGSMNSFPAQGKFVKCGDGVGIGTSCSFSCNVGPSSFSIMNSVDLQPVWGNCSNRNHCPWDSHNFEYQGDQQRKHFVNNHRASIGSSHYEHHSCSKCNSCRHFNVRYPQILPHHQGLPVMRPMMPAIIPKAAPLPHFQHFYCPIVYYHDIPQQMNILSSYPHPEYCTEYQFNPLPAPSQLQSAIYFSRLEQMHTLILKQVEYYFSSENLCKDLYLRSHMDNNGWVLIHLIAGFKRMKLLTDNISIICDALRLSRAVEVEGTKVRKRYGWNIWVLSRSNSNNNTGSENKSQITEGQQCLVSQMEKVELV